MNLTFDASSHKYFADGRELPSVSKVLRYLSIDFVNAVSVPVRTLAAERGTRIHEACTAYDIDGDIVEVDADIHPYVKAYADFKSDYRIKDWELFEHPMCIDPSKTYAYAGTLDRFGVVDGVPTIVDIKTGSNLYLDHYYAQLYAYKNLLVANGNTSPISCAILHLKKTGKYRFLLLKKEDIDKGCAIFSTCLALNKLTTKEKTK